MPNGGPSPHERSHRLGRDKERRGVPALALGKHRLWRSAGGRTCMGDRKVSEGAERSIHTRAARNPAELYVGVDSWSKRRIET